MGVMKATDQVTIVEVEGGDTTELEAKVEELNNNLTIDGDYKFKVGRDGDGNVCYYGADGSLIPFKSKGVTEFMWGYIGKFTATCSGQTNTCPVSALFNTNFNVTSEQTVGARWSDTSNTTGNSWAKIKFETAKIIESWLMETLSFGENNSFAKKYRIQASNDDTNWVDLFDEKLPDSHLFRFITTANNKAYTYYRLLIESSYRTDGCKGMAKWYPLIIL